MCLACLGPIGNITTPLLLSGSADRCIKVWDPRKGTIIEPPVLIQTLYRHTGTITALATYGDFVVSGGTDVSVRLWRCAEGREQLLYPVFEQTRVLAEMPAWVVGLAFSNCPAQGGMDAALFIGAADAHVKRVFLRTGLCTGNAAKIGSAPLATTAYISTASSMRLYRLGMLRAY
jgi:WD40 repeat protein